MGYIESGKDILRALTGLKKPIVLVIGGIFGMMGYVINTGLASTAIKIDTVALTVFILGIIAKVAFGTTGLSEIFGTVPEEIKKYGGRYSARCTNVWLPYLTASCEKTIVGITAGGVSAYLTYLMLQNPETPRSPLCRFLYFGGITHYAVFWFGDTSDASHNHLRLICSGGQ